MVKKGAASAEERLVRALEQLNRAVADMPAKYGYVFDRKKSLAHSFLQGAARGLGFVAAIAILVPLIIAFLQSFDWGPIIGSFVKDIVEQMEQLQSAPR
ncbi:MAG: DUF5665 domain-containing protein [Candidatus Peribacteraceae bacterium]|jgi:hypothetical protein